MLVPGRVQLARQELSPQVGHQRWEEQALSQSLVPNPQEEQRKLEVLVRARLQSLEPNQQEVLVQAQLARPALQQQEVNRKSEEQAPLKAPLM